MTSTAFAAIVLVSTAVSSHALMPLMRRMGHTWGLVDRPSWRRNQTEAVPCSGGLAIYITVFLSGAVLAFTIGLPFELRSVAALGLAGLGIMLLGVVDDRFGLHAEKKLLGQIGIVSLPMASGLLLQSVFIPFVGSVELGLMSGPITLLWYLGFINSINLIDGLDGLAGGIVALVLVGLWAVVAPLDATGSIWVLATLGAVLGFLRNNLSGHRIFLGDAGSMLIGLWLAGLALGLQAQSPSTIWIAVACMIVPLIDTTSTIARRWRRGVSVFRADDEHLHHRLLRIGTTPRRAMAVLLFVSVAGGAAGLVTLGRWEAAVVAVGALSAAVVELAYTLPRGGSPTATTAILYLLGIRASTEEAPAVAASGAHLAEVIAMQPYHRRRAAADTAAPNFSPAVTAEPAKVEPPVSSEEGEAEQDVVLALGEEQR